MRPRLLLLDLVQASPDRVRGEQSHGAHELIVVLDGRYAVRIGRRRLQAGPGQAVVIPAGVHHEPDLPADRSVHFYVLQWESDDEDAPLRDGHGGGHPATPSEAMVVQDRSARLQFLLDWMWQRRRVPGRVRRGAEPLLGLALEELDDLVSGHRDPGQPDDDVMRRALRYLEADLHRAPGSAELAAMIGLSPSQLLRRMRRATGLTPSQHLQRLRAATAVQLLRGSTLPQQAVAERVGLRSAAHLNRLVRRHTGRTPGEIRRGALARPPPARRP